MDHARTCNCPKYLSTTKCGLSFAKFAMKKCVKMNSNKYMKYSHESCEFSMNHFMVELVKFVKLLNEKPTPEKQKSGMKAY